MCCTLHLEVPRCASVLHGADVKLPQKEPALCLSEARILISSGAINSSCVRIIDAVTILVLTC